MQSTIYFKSLVRPASAAVTSKIAASGQLFQVRNHVKMYPWRKNRTCRESYLDSTRTPYTDKHNMNEFRSEAKLKPWQRVICKDKDARFNPYQWNDAYTSNPKVAKGTAMKKFDQLAESLKARGGARDRKAYLPPVGVQEKILSICESIGLGHEDPLTDRDIKFRLISSCIDMFKHDMPSSYLNDINTIQDVVDYFSTEVVGLNPYDNLVNKANELPGNLAILAEPARYNRESDECFKGYTAMPGAVNKVPGLRAAKKYPILNQDEFQWPDI